MGDTVPFFERAYFGNDIKAGNQLIFGREFKSVQEAPDTATLPELVLRSTHDIAAKAPDREETTRFFYENGRFTQGKVYPGDKPKVRKVKGVEYIEFETGDTMDKLFGNLLGKVAVIDYHNHPVEEMEKLIYEMLLRNNPQENPLKLQKDALISRLKTMFPSAGDLETFLKAQRDSNNRLIGSSDGNVMIARVNPHVPISGIVDIPRARMYSSEYNKLIEERISRYLGYRRFEPEEIENAELPSDIKYRVREIYLGTLAGVGDKAGFAVYYNFNTEDPLLRKAGEDIEL